MFPLCRRLWESFFYCGSRGSLRICARHLRSAAQVFHCALGATQACTSLIPPGKEKSRPSQNLCNFAILAGEPPSPYLKIQLAAAIRERGLPEVACEMHEPQASARQARIREGRAGWWEALARIIGNSNSFQRQHKLLSTLGGQYAPASQKNCLHCHCTASSLCSLSFSAWRS